MSVFYVFQGETYKEEFTGGYVWSPQLDKAGNRNAGYTMMTNIKKGDFILHNVKGKIVAISIAQTDCFKARQPQELSAAKTTVKWNEEGYRINTKYFEFDTPLITTTYTDWLQSHYIEGSAFTRVGRGKQQYMCSLADEHAIFLIKNAISMQKKKEVLSYLNNALADIVCDKESEYDSVEMETINEAVEELEESSKPEWSGKREKQEMTISSKTGRSVPKRNTKRAADALVYANYLCEYAPSDRTFKRKNGKRYTEPHHLIPISKYRDFEYSVDVMENIVSLCSHCHNLLHYGKVEEKAPLLTKLYNDRKDALKTCGLELTLEQLTSYYK